MPTVWVLLVVGGNADRLMSRGPLGSSRSSMPQLCCFSLAVSLTALATVAELHLVDDAREVETVPLSMGDIFGTALPPNGSWSGLTVAMELCTVKGDVLSFRSLAGDLTSRSWPGGFDLLLAPRPEEQISQAAICTCRGEKVVKGGESKVYKRGEITREKEEKGTVKANDHTMYQWFQSQGSGHPPLITAEITTYTLADIPPLPLPVVLLPHNLQHLVPAVVASLLPCVDVYVLADA